MHQCAVVPFVVYCGLCLVKGLVLFVALGVCGALLTWGCEGVGDDMGVVMRRGVAAVALCSMAYVYVTLSYFQRAV